MKTGVVVALCSLFAAAALLLSSYALYARFQQGNAYRKQQTTALRTVLCYFQSLTLANPKSSADERRRALHAYQHALKLIRAEPCSVSLSRTR